MSVTRSVSVARWISTTFRPLRVLLTSLIWSAGTSLRNDGAKFAVIWSSGMGSAARAARYQLSFLPTALSGIATPVEAPDATAFGVFVGAACSAVAQPPSSSASGTISLRDLKASPPVGERVPFSDTHSDQGHHKSPTDAVRRPGIG